MEKFKAFFCGILEFRNSYTTNFPDYDYEYELGREFAHKITFRKFDN